MNFFFPLLVLLGMILVVLALPPALKERSAKRFLIATAMSFVGILLPLFFFLMSAFLVPDWKGGCCHGWIDCFHRGKLALTPFVLLALAALYALDIYRVQKPIHKWIISGFFLGAVVSSVCFIYGLFAVGAEAAALPWLVVPLYVAVSCSFLLLEWIASRTNHESRPNRT